MTQVLSKSKMKHTNYLVAKYIHKLSTSFLKNIEVRKSVQNKKNHNQSRFFLVEGWSIEGRITKVVERIVMNVGLLNLHKTMVLIP